MSLKKQRRRHNVDFPRPSPDTGFGLHDSANIYANPPDVRRHAKALRSLGITWYKLLADNANKVERARIYREEGIMPIVRLYRGQPHPRYRPNRDVVRAYVQAGAPYIEFGNEPNIGDGEWEPNKFTRNLADFAEMIVSQWLTGAGDVVAGGGIALFFAMTPGGSLDHRVATDQVLANLARRGELDSIQAVAIHPRPHNNPPHEPWSVINTVTFNEYEWYVKTYTEALGHTPIFLVTEHGYSPTSSENANFPKIGLARWAEYNKVLFERMNPAHPWAVHRNVWALCYWLEAEGGSWREDQLANRWVELDSKPDDTEWLKALRTIRPTWDRGREEPPMVDFPGATWLVSPNKEPRPAGVKIDTVVLHATAGPLQAALAWLRNPAAKASAHYVIARDGSIFQLVREAEVAWHAGYSRMPDGREGVNRFSIGIELENANDGRDPYSEAQVAALVQLLGALRERYGIRRDLVVTHAIVRWLWNQAHPDQEGAVKTDPAGLDLAMVLNRVYGNPTAALEAAIVTAGQGLIIPLNPDAMFYKMAQQLGLGERLSGEYDLLHGGISYRAQVYEHGVVYAPAGQWTQYKVIPRKN